MFCLQNFPRRSFPKKYTKFYHNGLGFLKNIPARLQTHSGAGCLPRHPNTSFTVTTRKADAQPGNKLNPVGPQGARGVQKRFGPKPGQFAIGDFYPAFTCRSTVAQPAPERVSSHGCATLRNPLTQGIVQPAHRGLVYSMKADWGAGPLRFDDPTSRHTSVAYF